MYRKRFTLPLASSLRSTLVLALLAAAALADDRRTDKTRLTVVTFNAEFLFDGVLSDGQANFGWKGSPTEAEEHMAEIAAEIRDRGRRTCSLTWEDGEGPQEDRRHRRVWPPLQTHAA